MEGGFLNYAYRRISDSAEYPGEIGAIAGTPEQIYKRKVGSHGTTAQNIG